MASVNLTVTKESGISISLNGSVSTEMADKVADILSQALIAQLQTPTEPTPEV